MPFPDALEYVYHRLMDFSFARLHQQIPTLDCLRRCKLIAHRGEHDNTLELENTLIAFEQAAASGVWGIELDVRWTKDLVPVVAHDIDLHRIHGVGLRIDRQTHDTLRMQFKTIPSLNQVIEQFGSRLHLMIEIKNGLTIDMQCQSRILQDILAPLQPAEDYHLMALRPEILSGLTDIPPQAKVAIAYYWPDHLSRWVRNNRWGGLCAHYTLLRNSIVGKHKAMGQQTGTGYAHSRNVLFRELNRGIDWIFSNQAAKMQAILNAELDATNN